MTDALKNESDEVVVEFCGPQELGNEGDEIDVKTAGEDVLKIVNDAVLEGDKMEENEVVQENNQEEKPGFDEGIF